MTYGREGMLAMMVMSYDLTWKDEYAPRRWSSSELIQERTRGLPGNVEGQRTKHRSQNVLDSKR